jgi:1,4-dihydroxy-2-naphthoyl-CoA hydrolase
LPTDPDAFAYFASRGMGALADTMGIELLEVDRKHVVARMPVKGNTQPLGLLHGGAYVVLGESLGSMHANMLAGEGRFAVGVDINATHTSSATEGYVVGTCRPLHVGRSMMVHEIVVADEAGRRCSTIRITNFVRDARR